MVKIVKTLKEAQEAGFLPKADSQGSPDIMNILKEVNKAIEGIKTLREQNPGQGIPAANLQGQENKGIPVVGINSQNFNQLISELVNLPLNPNYKRMTLEQAQKKYSEFEEFLIPKIKDIVLRVTKIEYK